MSILREITPRSHFSWKSLIDVWDYRQLVYFLALRDFKVRYKQSIFGVGWAVFQPIIAVLLVTLALGNSSNIGGLPYPLFAASGFVFWFFFSNSLTKVSGSLTAHYGIITKIYFPRIIIPIAGVFVQIVDFLIGSAFLLVILLYYGYAVTFTGIISYFLMLIAATIGIIGIGLITSVLNARFRDIQFILPFFIQVSLFITPVFFLTSYLDATWIAWVHPLVNILNEVRIGLLNPDLLVWSDLFLAFISPLAWLFVGYFVFIHVDRNIIDVI